LLKKRCYRSFGEALLSTFANHGFVLTNIEEHIFVKEEEQMEKKRGKGKEEQEKRGKGKEEERKRNGRGKEEGRVYVTFQHQQGHIISFNRRRKRPRLHYPPEINHPQIFRTRTRQL